jgi:hypothetical protein
MGPVAILSRNQRRFGNEFVRQTGLNPAFVGSWILSEEPPGPTASGHADQNWLNIGNTDSQWYKGEWAGKSPEEAAQLSAKWIRGQYSVPGFGKPIQPIQDVLKTVGRGPDAQISALQKSGWATSGYPALRQVYDQYAGNFGLAKGGGRQVGSGNGGVGGAAVPAGAPQTRTVRSRPTLEYSGGDDGTALAALLAAGRQASAPIKPQGGITPPTFAAAPRLPQGYSPQALSAPPQRADSSVLAQQLAAVAQLQGPEATVRQEEHQVTLPAAPGAAPARRGGRSVPASEVEGVSAALQFASNRIGEWETAGSNRGPTLDQWERSFGFLGGPWCGAFVGKALQRAGIKVDPRIIDVDAALAMAREGQGGFVGEVSAKEVRPGDVVFWDEHTGIVEQVNRDGTIGTIEGNTGNGEVARRVHVKAQAGTYFARPAYPKGRR